MNGCLHNMEPGLYQCPGSKQVRSPPQDSAPLAASPIDPALPRDHNPLWAQPSNPSP